MKKCAGCGNLILENAVRCSYCGEVQEKRAEEKEVEEKAIKEKEIEEKEIEGKEIEEKEIEERKGTEVVSDGGEAEEKMPEVSSAYEETKEEEKAEEVSPDENMGGIPEGNSTGGNMGGIPEGNSTDEEAETGKPQEPPKEESRNAEKTQKERINKNQSEKEEARNPRFPHYCSDCGSKLEEGYQFCPKCGKEIKRREHRIDQAVHNMKLNPKFKSAETIVQDLKQGSFQYPQGALKVLGIIFGIVYAYYALQYLPYLNYYYASDKLWGLGMIAAHAWNALILFVIALRCQKEHGRSLAYALFGGIIFESVLQIIRIRNLLQYYGSDSSDYYPIIGGILAAFVCWHFMKKEDLILTAEESGSFGETVKKIPNILQQILFPGSQVTTEKKQYGQETPSELNPVQARIWQRVTSKTFLIFCFIYTINLIYPLLTDFSVLKLLLRLFSILLCIGFWRIYIGGKENKLNTGGFALLEGVMSANFTLQICLSVVIFILMLAIDLGDTGASLGILAVCAMLPGIFYWNSLRKTAISMKEISKGSMETVFASWYPILILILNVVFKAILLNWIISIQDAANSAVNSINRYSNGISSSAGSLFSLFGLDYNYGYGMSSSALQPIIEPITEWIQATFGFGGQAGIFGMLLALAVPVFEIIILFHIRSDRE